MGELIKVTFGVGKEKGRENPVVEHGQDAQYEAPKRKVLMLNLPDDLQKKLVNFRKTLNNDNINFHRKEFEEQERLVKGWTDKDVLLFVKNEANWQGLQSKPLLFTAIFERLMGEWMQMIS